MRKGYTILLLLFFISYLSPLGLSAQKASSQDSLWQLHQIQFARDISAHEFSGPNSPVYQGYEHIPYTLPVSGDPFYLSKDWQLGGVDFKGEQYHDLPLLYDIYKDELILQSPDKLYRIALSMDDVSSFNIGQHTFWRILRNDKENTGNLSSGYYELLYGGKVLLLAKRTKIVNVPTEPGMPRAFMEQDAYYIKKNDRYYLVKTKRSVLMVLEDKKNALKKFIRKNDLKFNRNKETALIKVLEYYDQSEK